MTTVDEIRAALDALNSTDENTLRMPAIVAFHNNAESWLRTLLPVVEAAREWRDVTEPKDCTMDEAVYVCDRLLEALAALEGGA